MTAVIPTRTFDIFFYICNLVHLNYTLAVAQWIPADRRRRRDRPRQRRSDDLHESEKDWTESAFVWEPWKITGEVFPQQ